MLLKRNCRPDQDPENEGIWPAKLDGTVSPDAHIGCNASDSQFISMTAETSVCVKYAIQENKPIRICVITTEWANKENLHDYSEGGDLKGATAKNFAHASKEWLADSVIIPATSCKMVYDELAGDNRQSSTREDYQALCLFLVEKGNVSINMADEIFKGYMVPRPAEKKVKQTSASADFLFQLLDEAAEKAANGDVIASHAVKALVNAITFSVSFKTKKVH